MPPRRSGRRSAASTASSKDDVQIKNNSLPSAAVEQQREEKQQRQAWLMKAEPDQRLEKGIDVSFGIDKFAKMPNQTTMWDGVRNPEARTMMKEKMRINDRVLFYHSNCKLPGIAGLAHIVKQGYPDHTAWDVKHPYYDAKTDKDNPKWYMVDVMLDRKLPNLVPLSLLQMLRDEPKRSLPYLTADHRRAISGMQLLNRGRLSVQHVEPLAYDAIVLLGDLGQWQDWPGKWQTKGAKAKRSAEDELRESSDGGEVDNIKDLRDSKAQESGPSPKRSRRKR